MSTPTEFVQPPFDDAAAAALAAQLRAAARDCDHARDALRRDRAMVAISWRGPAGDDALDRAGRIVAELERVSAACSHRARWLEEVRAHEAANGASAPSGLRIPGGFRLGPPVSTSTRSASGR